MIEDKNRIKLIETSQHKQPLKALYIFKLSACDREVITGTYR